MQKKHLELQTEIDDIFCRPTLSNVQGFIGTEKNPHAATKKDNVPDKHFQANEEVVA